MPVHIKKKDITLLRMLIINIVLLKNSSALCYIFYILFSNKQFASFAGAKPRNHSAPVDMIRTATAGDELQLARLKGGGGTTFPRMLSAAEA